MDVIMLLALKGNQFSVHAQYELSILINEDEVSVSDWLEKWGNTAEDKHSLKKSFCSCSFVELSNPPIVWQQGSV